MMNKSVEELLIICKPCHKCDNEFKRCPDTCLPIQAWYSLTYKAQNLQRDVEIQTMARKTAVEELRIVLDENKRLQQLADADRKYVCERKPECRG